MSSYTLSVDFFGNTVRAQTDGNRICLNDLFMAGNAYRLSNGKPALQMSSFLASKNLHDYREAAAEEWNIPADDFIKREGKGAKTRTYAHISIAMLAAESISPRFHAHVHRVFIEGKLLEFRERGGTEFMRLNAAIDQYLPGRTGKDNKGVFIQTAKQLRGRILGAESKAGDWDSASVDQTHTRYEWEHQLCGMLRLGLVKNYDHLKEIISKL